MLKRGLTKTQAVTLIFSLFSLVIYIFFLSFGLELRDNTAIVLKYILSWLGLFEIIYVFYSWHSLTGNYLCLYTYFVVFFMLFNYGQCFAWMFGLTGKEEIGKINLFYKLSVPTNQEIVVSQSIVLISLMMIHLGALLQKKETHSSNYTIESTSINDQGECLYTFCKLVLPVVTFCEFWVLILNVQQSRIYGYTALYYNKDVVHANVIIQIIARWFYPTLYGILIGKKFGRHIKLVFTLVLIDVVLGMASGDRGGWLYATVMLLLLYHKYYKPFGKKTIIIGAITTYFGASVLLAVRNIRNYGVTFAGLRTALISTLTNPFGEALISIGRTMGITTALVMEGYDIYPYGNSFVYGLITCLSGDIKDILHLNYIGPSGWFSQHYLGISNGAGFSIIGEMLINFGPILFIPFMIIFGIIIGKITDIDGKNINEEPLAVTMRIILTVIVVGISRNAFGTVMGEVVYTFVLFYVGYKMFRGTVWKRRYA